MKHQRILPLVSMALAAAALHGQSAGSTPAPPTTTSTPTTGTSASDLTAAIAAGKYPVILTTQPPPALPPPVTKRVSKDVPPPPAPQPLPPGTQPSAETLEKIRKFKPSPEAMAKWQAAHAVVPKPLTLPIKKPTLGLPRLAGKADAKGAAPLAADKFELDALAPAAGAAGQHAARQLNVDTLVLDPGTEWSRNLRGNPHDVTFVSLNLYASVTTVIQAGGAWLSVLPGEKTSGVGLATGAPDGAGGIKWTKAGVESPQEIFAGQTMGALPILTLRLDPDAGTWDLYSGFRLVATGLPLVTDGKKPARTLLVRAGPAGAWLNAVGLSDENPLFADANANGIDDAFEIAQTGSLLPANAPVADRAKLARQWQHELRQHASLPVLAVRPPPDRLVAKAKPNG